MLHSFKEKMGLTVNVKDNNIEQALRNLKKKLQREGLFYLAHSFRKSGKPVYREIYLGKSIPLNIELIKENFLRKCFEEELFKKFNLIKLNHTLNWKKFPPSVKKNSLIDSSIQFTFNSNAIEGSTVTLSETEDIVKYKISPHKPLADVKETINHSKVFLSAISEKSDLSVNLILAWHKELFFETKQDIAGKLRDYLVRVGTYVAPDWQDLDVLLSDFFKWYISNKRIMHPVELAARAHYKFEKIHPFGDGNGRIGRLLIANILWRNNFPILVIDYKKRKSYYSALSKDELKFLPYFSRRYVSYFKSFL